MKLGPQPDLAGRSAGRLPDARRTHAGRLPDGQPDTPGPVKPDIQCVRTHWIRGFMAFHRVQRTLIVMLVVPV